MEPVDNISLWKKKSEIDYAPLFLSLWVAFNVWMNDRWGGNKRRERDLINLIKDMDNEALKNEFIELIHGEGAEALTFRGYFAALHDALEKTDLDYDGLPKKLKNADSKKISFSNCIIDLRDDEPKLVSVVVKKIELNRDEEEAEEYDDKDEETIKIGSNFWVKNNNDDLFAAYIEILYKVRCHVVHGDLELVEKNERVLKYLYLTLSMIMKPLGRS